jgi:spore maturation protein CgeB
MDRCGCHNNQAVTQSLNVFIEGPRWVGLWTEVIADTLAQSGHRVEYCYHNHKRPTDRIALLGSHLLPGVDRRNAWTQRYRKQLFSKLDQFRPDILLSIQGKIDADAIKKLREKSPQLKVIFWWGDVLTDQGLEKIKRAAKFSDRLLVSYRGAYEKLKPLYTDQLVYFPFGVSERFHRPTLSDRDREQFTADVSFVGTCYPERCELIRYLNMQLDTPVQVRGRGWQHCRGVDSKGPLSLQDSLKVHACSRISLNLHHGKTDNGFNMKFYEIPAAGGFQLCDWQAAMDETELGRQTPSCRDLPEFAEKVRYYLAHEQARREISDQTTQTVYATASYPEKLARLFNLLD